MSSVDGLAARPRSGAALLFLAPEVATDSLLAPEVATVSLLTPEVATVSYEAESPPEAAAVGPRGDQAVVGGGGLLLGPLCPVGFDLNLLISSDELFKQPCCLASAVEPKLHSGRALHRACVLPPVPTKDDVFAPNRIAISLLGSLAGSLRRS